MIRKSRKNQKEQTAKPAQDEKRAETEKSAKQDEKGAQQEKKHKPEEKNAPRTLSPKKRMRSSNTHSRRRMVVAASVAAFPPIVTMFFFSKIFELPKAILTITDSKGRSLWFCGRCRWRVLSSLVWLEFTGSTLAQDYFSYPMYLDLRDQNQGFESLIASDLQNVSVTWNNQPEMVGCELASGLGLALRLRPGAPVRPRPEIVPNSGGVGFNYWKRHCGSDPRIINRSQRPAFRHCGREWLRRVSAACDVRSSHHRRHYAALEGPRRTLTRTG